jgi:hypothetical protein
MNSSAGTIDSVQPRPIQQAFTEISSLAKRLRSAHSRGRNALFVVGAGVSSDAGIPLMTELLKHLRSLIEARGGAPELAEVNTLLKRSIQGRSRSDIALLFSALQDAPDKNHLVRKIWSQFCGDLMAGGVVVPAVSQGGSLLLRDPTTAHRWIASMCLDFGAQCLSLNFDGLTRRAINQRLEGQKRNERCVLLDDSAKIASFFGRDKMDPRLWGVLKLRGDIFYAVCETSGCPLQMVETAVYELSGEVDPDHQDGSAYLSCPECFNERNCRSHFQATTSRSRKVKTF